MLLLVAAYTFTALLLSLYGLHRWLMAGLYLRTRGQSAALQACGTPAVTVQLPVFNERFVVERLIDAAALLDWPRLQIQVLDDSTDDCTMVARAAVERWRRRGVDIALIHRGDRQGFKAGALDDAMAQVTGEFIAIFDADFLPAPDFLRKAMPAFAADVGVVQARWGHIDERASLLSRLQALLLDGHFVVEHTARHRSGRWFNFNGTAGIWRRRAIDDAGGWQHDTLTEDLDLSYRAQLQGWRFVYLPDLVVPAELPSSMEAFRTQQHRWCKGSIQTLLKLGWRLVRSPVSLRVKSEALIHLSSNLAYPLVLLLALLNPVTVWLRGWHAEDLLLLDLLVFVCASAGVSVFYAVSQWAAYPDWPRRLLRIPGAMALGIGLSVSQTVAVFEALAGQASPFVRTPKGAYGSSPRFPGAELALTVLHLAAACTSLYNGWYQSLPLQLLFLFGFGYASWGLLAPESWGSLWKGSATSKAPAPATSSAEAEVASMPMARSSSGLEQPDTVIRKVENRRASM